MQDPQAPHILPKLSINRPKRALEEYQIHKSPVTVGRLKSNDIVILGDAAISREHCRFDISTSSGELTIRDLGSSNGTFLNGESVGVEPLEIMPGDKIQVGATIITYSVDRPSVGAIVRMVKPKFKNAPMPPQPGENEKTAFKEGYCTCGRCGETFSIPNRGPGDKVGCVRCRAVWKIPVVKPDTVPPADTKAS